MTLNGTIRARLRLSTVDFRLKKKLISTPVIYVKSKERFRNCLF